MEIKNYIWIIPFVSFLSGYILLAKIFTTEKFPTPSIVGTQILQAVTTLSNHNLNIRFIAQKNDPDLPQGTVLSQTPHAGKNIKPRQSVYVVISKKPPKTRCPNLVNQPIDSIIKIVEEKNIRNKSYLLPGQHPNSFCIAQSPTQSTLLKENSVITYISCGNKKSVLLPNLKNKKVFEIVDFLKNYPVKIEIVHSKQYKSDDTDCQDKTVIDQRPLAGSIVTLDKNNPLLIHLKV